MWCDVIWYNMLYDMTWHEYAGVSRKASTLPIIFPKLSLIQWICFHIRVVPDNGIIILGMSQTTLLYLTKGASLYKWPQVNFNSSVCTCFSLDVPIYLCLSVQYILTLLIIAVMSVGIDITNTTPNLLSTYITIPTHLGRLFF